MREYKFRAWDSWWGRMYYFDFTKNIEATPDDELKGLWILHEEGSVYAIQEKIKIMQFTGLHDKNGKEIYEGDVVECYQQGQSIRGYIIYEDACFFVKFSNGQKAWIDGAIKKFKANVIGNIHDNPDLKEVSHEA